MTDDFDMEDHDLVVAEGVEISIDGQAILHDVDLRVASGQIITIIGPNGAGKSTLVKAILGLTPPNRGTIRRRPKIQVGYVPQHLHIDGTFPLTARRFLQLSRKARDADVRSAADEVGAPDVLDRPFQELSGGETKRIMLARALLNDPDLLVLDEPTANIDVAGQAEFYDLVRAIRDRRQCGVLLVSHDLHLVMAATDYVLCLNGHVCCRGAPESVSMHPEYLSLFGDSVARSLGVYTHAHDHHHDLHGEAVPEHDAAREHADG